MEALVISRDDATVGELSPLREEGDLRTQPAHVFVDLQEDLIVLEKRLPLAVWVGVQRVVRLLRTVVVPQHNFLCKIGIQFEFYRLKVSKTRQK